MVEPIGFVGLGRMGVPMVRALSAAGYRVHGHDTSASAMASLDEITGATGVALADVAQCSVIITMLPDGKAVRAVASALAPDMAAGAILVDMSTSSPGETLALPEVLPATVSVVDAPVSGGVRRAVSATLTIMAGGTDAAVETVTPILSSMGTVIRCGGPSAGHAMKVLNNYLSASGLAAACEAVRIGRAAGLDPDVMADVFNGSTGRSNATEVKLKQHVNNEAYASGFTMGLMAKDLALAARLASGVAVAAPGLETCAALYADGVESYGPEADHTEIDRLIGTRANRLDDTGTGD